MILPRKKVCFFSIIFCLINVLSFGQTVESNTYGIALKTLLSHTISEVSVKDVSINLDEYDFVLDTRERNEYDVSRLPNAVFVGYDNFNISSIDSLSKNARILLYCSVGYRSEKIGEQLKKAGYSNVKNLYGGIFEWKNQNRELVDLDGNITNQVHAYDRVWGRFLRKGEKIYNN